MSKQFRIHALAACALALAFSVSAQAGASRTFVSTTGNDANTAVNCSPSANCRTFAAALSVTNSGGEIVVLTSGGYGPATIAQPVVISAIGVDASISVTTPGTHALVINTPGNVTITGLNLHGEGIGGSGIEVIQVGFLHLYDMLIENFGANGVDFEASGELAVYGSAFNDNDNAGLQINGGGGTFFVAVYVQDSSFDHNGFGVEDLFGRVTVANSSAQYNNTGFLVEGGNLTLSNDRAIFNSTALSVVPSAALYFENCLISNNGTAYNIVTGGTLAGSNPGTSLSAPGQSTSGTLSTAIALQ